MNTAPKGFVILFTILVSTIIMLIGLGIYSIATRETVLSGTAREAQYAFYAADAGVECALYAQNLDNTGSGGSLHIDANSNGGAPFDCGTGQVVITGQGTVSTPFEFSLVVDQNQKTCAKVSMLDSTSLAGSPIRRVLSQGYNICNGTAPLKTNPILVERDLDTTYVVGGVAAPSATGTTP